MNWFSKIRNSTSSIPQSAFCNKKGVVGILALFLMLVLVLFAIATALLTRFQFRNMSARLNEVKALYIAEAGIEKAIWRLKNNIDDDFNGNLEGGSYQVTVTGSPPNVTVTSEGDVRGVKRILRLTVEVTGGGSSYSYSQWRYDLGRAGYNPNVENDIPGGEPNRQLNFNSGTPQQYSRSSPILARVNGELRLYQASFEYPGWTGHLSCYRIDTPVVGSEGTLLWDKTLSGGPINHSTPAVVDGVVYIGTDEGKIRAYDADNGNLLWSYSPGAPYIDSSPLVFQYDDNGTQKTYLIIGEGTDGNDYHCLDVSNNPNPPTEVWNYTTGGGAWSSPAIAEVEIDGETKTIAYFGSGYPDHNVYAVDVSDGTTLWTYSTGTKSWENVSATPAVVDGIVYVGDENGVFHAINAKTGTAIWTKKMNGIDSDEGEHWENAIHSSAAVHNGKVYFGVGGSDSSPTDKKYRFYCLDASDGSIIWSYKFSKNNEKVWASPMIANGVVYIPTLRGYVENDVPPEEWTKNGQGYMYAFDADTGQLLWSDNMEGKVRSSPFIFEEHVYITTFKNVKIRSWGSPTDYPLEGGGGGEATVTITEWKEMPL